MYGDAKLTDGAAKIVAVNKHKRGEAPLPAAKKTLVPSVVVQQRESKSHAR